MTSYRILIIDDSKFTRQLLKEVLLKEGHEVIGEVDRRADVGELYMADRPDAVILNASASDEEGLQELRTILAVDPRAAVIVCCFGAQQEMIVNAMRMGASGYLLKPFKPEDIRACIANHLAGRAPSLSSAPAPAPADEPAAARAESAPRPAAEQEPPGEERLPATPAAADERADGASAPATAGREAEPYARPPAAFSPAAPPQAEEAPAERKPPRIAIRDIPAEQLPDKPRQLAEAVQFESGLRFALRGGRGQSNGRASAGAAGMPPEQAGERLSPAAEEAPAAERADAEQAGPEDERKPLAAPHPPVGEAAPDDGKRDGREAAGTAARPTDDSAGTQPVSVTQEELEALLNETTAAAEENGEGQRMHDDDRMNGRGTRRDGEQPQEVHERGDKPSWQAEDERAEATAEDEANDPTMESEDATMTDNNGQMNELLGRIHQMMGQLPPELARSLQPAQADGGTERGALVRRQELEEPNVIRLRGDEEQRGRKRMSRTHMCNWSEEIDGETRQYTVVCTEGENRLNIEMGSFNKKQALTFSLEGFFELVSWLEETIGRASAQQK